MTNILIGNRYRMLEKIDSGGMADIYKAECLRTNKTVAVKVLKDKFSVNPEYVRRFKKEAETVLALEHQNIVSVIDVGFDGGVYYIVMEFIEGSTLKALIEKKSRIEESEAVKYAIQVCSALSAAHRKGIIHRDVKPHNILIDNEDNVKLTDFGIAKSISSIEEQEGKVIGSVHYISPEQARGEKIDTRSDIYSLGIVLYEMVTGILPHVGGKTVSVALKHINEQITPPAEINGNISEALNHIILKTTSKNKKDRYQSVNQLKADLARSAADPEGRFLDISEANKKPFIDPHKQKKKNLYWKAGMLALLVAVLSAAAIFILSLFNSSDTAFVVPNLLGADIESAVKSLHDLTVNTVYEPSESAKEGTVISQSPEAGSNAASGGVVNLTISSGPADLVMPYLYGATLEEAKAQLNAMDIKLEKNNITYEFQPGTPPGLVISQTPEAGDALDETAIISIVVSSEDPEEGAIMPDLKDSTVDESVSILNNLGFENCFIYEEVNEAAPGTVIRQTPEQGIQTAFTDNIYLTVSAYKEKKYECKFSRSIDVTEKGSKIGIVVQDKINGITVNFLSEETTDQFGTVVLNKELSSLTSGDLIVIVYVNNIKMEFWTVEFK